jgi:amidase
MKASDYVVRDATGLAELVHDGDVTPIELAEAAIERIEALNPTLNAVTETCFDAARQEAVDRDRRAPLAGVPFLAKDMNIEVRGLKLTASCRWLDGLPPADTDAPLAATWRQIGLSILGRTNLPEFAEDFVTEPTARGPTRNPWDLTRSPGGSSGGAAVAVASGMVPVAHGTDSGGSIRVPASACGLVGLKPSRGLVPVGPHHDELAGGLDCEHVLTRTVRDCALLLDLTTGPEATMRFPYRPARRTYLEALTEFPKGLRVGVVLRAPGGVLADDPIAAVVQEMVGVLGRAGHTVRPFAFPPETDIGEAAALVWMTAIAEEVAHCTTRVGRPPFDDEIEFVTRECLRHAQAWRAVDYVAARRAMTRATHALVDAMRDVDLLMLPTTATLPPPIGAIDGCKGTMTFEEWGRASYRYAPYTEISNVTGMPAISLPLGVGPGGLPVGVQFIAPMGRDDRLLSFAAWLEREVPWSLRTTALLTRCLAVDGA